MGRNLVALYDAWQQAVIDGADADPPATLFRDPAAPEMIAALETRLGLRLPTSYRAFLEHTDGALAFPGWGIVGERGGGDISDGLLSAKAVGRLRDVEPVMLGWGMATGAADDDPAWRHPGFDSRDTERDHLFPDGTNDAGDEKSGHLLYAIAISVNVDGYQTMLNPLVVDADGEWEAWDYGTKLPGAIRHASFADLIEADIARMDRFAANVAATLADLDPLVARVNDPSATVDDRLSAAWEAWSADTSAGPALVPGLRSIGLDQGLDLTPRQRALHLLVYIGGREAMDTLGAASREPQPRIHVTTVPALAASDDPVDREVAIAILSDPATPSFVAGSVYHTGSAVLWEAYRRSRSPELLATLARLGVRDAADDIVLALSDPDRPDEEVRGLLTYAAYVDDPRMPSVLATAARRRPEWRMNVGRSLVSRGAYDEAIPLLDEAIRDGQGFGVGEAALAETRDPRAASALIASLRQTPSAEVAASIGWFPTFEAVAALEAAAGEDELRNSALDALELMATPDARDSLDRRASAGDVLATRALGRLRDVRARDRLLALLADPDPGLAYVGADGLRNVRDPSTAAVLLEAAAHPDADVAVVATHALLTMAAQETPTALAALATSPDAQARRLAARWSARWIPPEAR